MFFNLFHKPQSVPYDPTQIPIGTQCPSVPLSDYIDADAAPGHNPRFLYHGTAKPLNRPENIIVRRHIQNICANTINIALRFALNRSMGTDQVEASDFFAFATQRYKIVIVAPWVQISRLNRDAPFYIYRVNGKLFDNFGETQQRSVQVISRTDLSLARLGHAGFAFYQFNGRIDSLMFVSNDDASIQTKVIPFLRPITNGR